MLRTLTPVYAATSSGVAAAYPCDLINLQGYYSGGAGGMTDAWLQIHDVTAVPADGAVPLKSFALPAALAYSWKFDPGYLFLKNGLYVCISTTEGTKTLSAATADFLIDIEEYEIQPTGTSTAGDTTTGVDQLQVWTEAQGPKKLVKIEWKNNEGADRYLMIFARDDWADGQKPVHQFGPLATTASKVLKFGNDGLWIQQIPSSNSGALKKGCYIVQSTTAIVLTTSSGTVSTIKATYKALP